MRRQTQKAILQEKKIVNTDMSKRYRLARVYFLIFKGGNYAKPKSRLTQTFH